MSPDSVCAVAARPKASLKTQQLVVCRHAMLAQLKVTEMWFDCIHLSFFLWQTASASLHQHWHWAPSATGSPLHDVTLLEQTHHFYPSWGRWPLLYLLWPISFVFKRSLLYCIQIYNNICFHVFLCRALKFIYSWKYGYWNTALVIHYVWPMPCSNTRTSMSILKGSILSVLSTTLSSTTSGSLKYTSFRQIWIGTYYVLKMWLVSTDSTGIGTRHKYFFLFNR